MSNVEELKQRGNAAAQSGDMEEAIECYTSAITLDSTNHTLYSNRSNFYY